MCCKDGTVWCVVSVWGWFLDGCYFCETVTDVFSSRLMDCCLSLQRVQCKGRCHFNCIFSILILFFSVGFHLATLPPLYSSIHNPVVFFKNYLHRPIYLFQELYYAYKLDLDCVTDLIDQSVMQEITAYGLICPYEPLSQII